MAVFQLVLIQEIHEHLHHINIKMKHQAWLELFIVKTFTDFQITKVCLIVMIVKYHLSFIIFF